MKECNCDLRDGDAKTAVFGSNEMLQPAPVDTIPMEPTTPQIAYQMVKDETFAQTQPRLNLATFVTTYMDDYATKLMNEAISINYILSFYLKFRLVIQWKTWEFPAFFSLNRRFGE